MNWTGSSSAMLTSLVSPAASAMGFGFSTTASDSTATMVAATTAPSPSSMAENEDELWDCLCKVLDNITQRLDHLDEMQCCMLGHSQRVQKILGSYYPEMEGEGQRKKANCAAEVRGGQSGYGNIFHNSGSVEAKYDVACPGGDYANGDGEVDSSASASLAVAEESLQARKVEKGGRRDSLEESESGKEYKTVIWDDSEGEEILATEDDFINDMQAEADVMLWGDASGDREYKPLRLSDAQSQIKIVADNRELIIAERGEAIKSMQAQFGAQVVVPTLLERFGEELVHYSTYMIVLAVDWWSNGHKIATGMRELLLCAYGVGLGYAGLRENIPMEQALSDQSVKESVTDPFLEIQIAFAGSRNKYFDWDDAANSVSQKLTQTIISEPASSKSACLLLNVDLAQAAGSTTVVEELQPSKFSLPLIEKKQSGYMIISKTDIAALLWQYNSSGIPTGVQTDTQQITFELPLITLKEVGSCLRDNKQHHLKRHVIRSFSGYVIDRSVALVLAYFSKMPLKIMLTVEATCIEWLTHLLATAINRMQQNAVKTGFRREFQGGHILLLNLPLYAQHIVVHRHCKRLQSQYYESHMILEQLGPAEEDEGTQVREEKQSPIETIQESTTEWALLNNVMVIWLHSSTKVSDTGYTKFSHLLAMDFSEDELMAWCYFNATGAVESNDLTDCWNIALLQTILIVLSLDSPMGALFGILASCLKLTELFYWQRHQVKMKTNSDGIPVYLLASVAAERKSSCPVGQTGKGCSIRRHDGERSLLPVVEGVAGHRCLGTSTF